MSNTPAKRSINDIFGRNFSSVISAAFLAILILACIVAGPFVLALTKGDLGNFAMITLAGAFFVFLTILPGLAVFWVSTSLLRVKKKEKGVPFFFLMVLSVLICSLLRTLYWPNVGFLSPMLVLDVLGGLIFFSVYWLLLKRGAKKV